MMMGFFISIKTLSSFSHYLFSFFSDLLCLISLSSLHWSEETPTPRNDEEKQGNDSISVGEINLVMGILGMRSEAEEDRDSIVKRDEVEGVFGEEEPSLEEIREAFEVFDEKRDGFIDAEELARVLHGLGFIRESQGSDDQVREKCKNMIRGFDRNGGGLLDFHDFLKLMELSLNLS